MDPFRRGAFTLVFIQLVLLEPEEALAAVNPNPGNGERPDINGGRGQKELADLLLLALEDAEFGALMEEAIEVVRGSLGVGLVCVMEATHDRAELVLRAGAGWRNGEVGKRFVSTGMVSPVERVSMAGYAMMSKDPVCAENLYRDPRFAGCPLMREHGVVSGIMAKIDVGGKLYGVIGAHCTEQRSFQDDEAYWLRDVSRALGGALSRKARPHSRGVQDSALPPNDTSKQANSSSRRARRVAAGLQPRQMEVLELLNEGYRVKQIAAELYCTENNVNKHLQRIYRALGAHGQVAAIVRARRLGLFDY